MRDALSSHQFDTLLPPPITDADYLVGEVTLTLSLGERFDELDTWTQTIPVPYDVYTAPTLRP